MKKSVLIILTVILVGWLIAGIAFVAIGAGTIKKDEKFVETAEWRDALVHSEMNSDMSRTTVLYYNVDGTNYEPVFDMGKDGEHYIGETIRIYFDKSTPEDYFVETAKIFYVLLYVGIALILVTVTLLAIIYIPIYKRSYARKNGKTELVKINEIVDVIGGQKIICDGTKIKGRNGTPFKSTRIERNLPTYILNSAVTVYYVPKHKSFYYVDTNTIKFREEK